MITIETYWLFRSLFKRGEHFIGLFLIIPVGQSWTLTIRPGEFCYQSFGGLTDLYILAGPTLLEVVRRYAKLTEPTITATLGVGLSPMSMEVIRTRRNFRTSG